MGFRFRKSVKAGPFRLNFSKSGIGYSVGTKGFRYTKKANGGTRTTASIPGTGISYVKETGGKRGNTMRKNDGIEPITAAGPSRQNRNQEQPEITLTEVLLAWFLGALGAHKFYRKKVGMGFLYLFTLGLFYIGWIGDAIWLTIQYRAERKDAGTSKGQKYGAYVAAALCVLILGSCSQGRNADIPATDPTGAKISAVETTVETTAVPTEPATTAAATTEVPTTEPPTTAPETTAAPTTEPPTTDPETTAASTTEPPGTEPETTAEATQETSEPPKVETTYILNTNSGKFHYPWCRSVDDMKDSNKSTFTGTREEVIAKGYDPCGNCHP